MLDISIRNGSKDDMEEILKMYFAGSGRRPPEELVRQCLTNEPSVVALSGEAIVGFVFCRRFAADIVEIANLFVDETFRGSGVGSKLIRKLENELVGKCESVIVSNSMLVVGVPNKRPADQFYLQRGYEQVWYTGSTFVFMKQIPGQQQ